MSATPDTDDTDDTSETRSRLIALAQDCPDDKTRRDILRAATVLPRDDRRHPVPKLVIADLEELMWEEESEFLWDLGRSGVALMALRQAFRSAIEAGDGAIQAADDQAVNREPSR